MLSSVNNNNQTEQCESAGLNPRKRPLAAQDILCVTSQNNLQKAHPALRATVSESQLLSPTQKITSAALELNLHSVICILGIQQFCIF